MERSLVTTGRMRNQSRYESTMHPFRLFDSVEASLSLPGFLLLEHPQTSHSLKSVRCGKLPHPDAFTQVPTCCLYFCDHFANVALLSKHFFLNQIKHGVSRTLVHLTCSPRGPGLLGAALTAASHSPDSLAITALVTLLRSGWRLSDSTLRHSFNPPIFLSCSSDWGRGVFYSTSDEPHAAVALLAQSLRSFDR